MKTKPGVSRSVPRKPSRTKKVAVEAPTNGSADVVFDIGQAAAFLKVADIEIQKLIDSGNFPGRKLGAEWRVLKSAICDWLNGNYREPNDWREANRRLLEAAGSWKDDDFLDDLVDNVYRERKKIRVEGGAA